MADASTITLAPAATPAATEVSVSDIAAHYAAIVASAQAHVALIQSKPALYPGGLPAVLDNMMRQVNFLVARVQAAAPATS